MPFPVQIPSIFQTFTQPIYSLMKLILSRRILNHGHGFNPTTPTSILLLLLLLSGPGRAQSPGSPSDPYGNLNPSMGVVIIILIASFFFIGLFSIYVRHCSSSSSATGVRRSLAGSVARSRRAPRGLDKAVIETFPTFDYAAVKELKIGKGALECAVCLTEFEDDDTLRLIPKCDHVFHPDCIDAWLVGHATCPVCRTNLVPDPVSGTCSPPPQNDTVAEASEAVVEERESMEEPLQGSRTMRRNISIGRPRWLGRMRFTRSYSTGHVAVKQWENIDRFRLRLPVEVRKQLMNGKLERSTSLVVLPRETSTRRGYRTGFSEGVRSGSVRSGPDRWVFSLAPPFFSRAQSVKSPGIEGSLRGSIRAESTRLPV